MNNSIKKLIMAFLATIGIAIAMPIAAMAAPAQTDVTGTVTNSGHPVAGAHVTVTCNGHSRNTITDSKGAYLVIFSQLQCPTGKTATASATKKHVGSGSNTGSVNSAGNDKLNIAIINIALPEFALLTGIGAAIAGGGAFLAIRRRELNGNRK